MGDSSKTPIRALFICHYNRKRSATAERVFGKDPALDVLSAGTSDEAMVQVNARMLEWADIVFVMDGLQVEALGKMFPDHPVLPHVVCLDIEDNYHFLDPALVATLEEKTRPHFDRIRAAGAGAHSQ
jgi:protein-tyrosine phosphatase